MDLTIKKYCIVLLTIFLPFLFKDANGSDLAVNWSPNLKVEISAFKPDIFISNERKCNNIPFWMKADPNSPGFSENSGLVYDWEYGLVTYTFKKNQVFTDFMNNIAESLYNKCIAKGGLNCNDLLPAICNTSYAFMTDYLYLYENLPYYKGYIAQLLLNAILNQDDYYLSDDEKNFLEDEFKNVLFARSDCPVPYLPDISVKKWIPFETGIQSTESVQFSPGSKLSELTERAELGFKARARSTITGELSQWSDEKRVTVLPSPPHANSISTKQSCADKATGEITLSDITSPVNTFSYTYRIVNSTTSCVSGILDAETTEFEGCDITIKNNASGLFNLCLTYQDPAINNCFTEQSITVESLPKLNYQISTKDVSCPGGTDGNIRVILSQWAGDFKILANGTTVNNNSDCTFTGLSADSYDVIVSDYCLDKKSEGNMIKQPQTVVIKSIDPKKPTCISSPNGGFTVEASGISNGKYNYYVYKESDYPSGRSLITDSAQGSTWGNYTLPGGSYIINVRDYYHPECPGDVSLVKLLVPVTPLDLKINKVDKVKCFGGNSGAIDVSAGGGSGYYKFNIGDDPVASSTGKFMSLQALSYTVSVRNSDESCADVASKVVTVGTNPVIEINLTPKDANCFENKDGQINTVITGGSGSYNSYYWEQKVHENWSWYPASGASPTNFYAGEYQVKVTDSENCYAYGYTTVNQPAPLYLSHVTSTDVKCLGGTGQINIEAMGGNGGYSFTYSENNWASSSVFTSGSLFSAGTYLLKVKDSKGCEAVWEEYGEEKEVIITGPSSALNFGNVLSDYNGFNISGYGKSDGKIAVNATGGNGENGSGAKYSGYTYSISGSNYQADSIFPTLSVGTHEIKVRDGRGCQVSKLVTLTQPDELILKATSIKHVKCFGLATGEITLSAMGGAGPYEYMIGQGSFVSSAYFAGLSKGNYSFTVRDKNGCTDTLSSVITNIYPEPAITLLPQDIKCYQKSDGIIQASLSGGSGSFGLKWYLKSGNSWQYIKSDSTLITTLAPGEYRIQATDLAGCPTIYDSTVVYQKVSPLVINKVTLRDIVCYSESGSIDIQASGSNGGYIYQYSKTNMDFVNYSPGAPLPSAEYAIRVKDSKGCATNWPENIVITQPAKSLDFTWTAKGFNGFNVSCFGTSDGRITVKPSGGNGSGYEGYSYLLSGKTIQTDSVFSNLSAGAYNLSITDGRGCIVSRSVSLLQPSAPLGLVVSELQDTKCFNDSSGVIILEASGGNLPYEYKIGQENFVSETKFEKLPTGDYNFTVRDKNGCISGISSVISNIFSKPSLSLIPQEISCYQKNDGSVQSSLTGGSGNFGLKWFMKTGSSWNYFKSDLSRIAQLAPGDYRIQVTDLAGCPSIYDSTSVIQRVTPLVISQLKLLDIVCFGNSGSVDIEASGSNGGYIYQYSQNNQSYLNYSPGAPLPFSEYKFRVRDAKGCETIWPENLVITQPDKPLDITWLAKDYAGYNVSCFGNNDGRMIVTPSGGNGTGYQGYSFLLSGRPPQRDTLFEQLSAGDYVLKVTDGRGCTINHQIKISQPVSELGLWPTGIKMATCIKGSDGRVSLAASGGSLPYTYSAGNDVFFSGSEFSNLKVNSYRFTVKDANGCTQIFDTSIINLVPEMDLTGRISDANCFGQNSGTISVSISGGVKPFTYKWKDLSATNPYVENLLKGNYNLTVTDSAGCISDKIFEVKEPLQPLIINSVKVKDIVCYGESGSIQILASGSNGGYTYQYSVNTRPPENYISGNPLPFGSYRIRAKDVKGCETEWPEYVTITQPPRALGLTLKAKDFNGSNVLCFGDSNGQLIVIPYGGNGEGYQGYSYLLSGRPIQTDTVFSDLKAGNYSIKITDGRGCSSTLPVSLHQPSVSVGLTVSKLTNTKCFNDSTGSIKLLASGGVQPYEYLIGEENFVTFNEFKKLPAGNYHFMVRDGNGCLDSMGATINNTYPKPSITLLPQDIRCYQKNDGQVQASLTGGSGSFGLNWYKKSGDTWQYLRSDSSRITGLAPGDYRVQVTDLANCPSLYDSTTIYQKVTPLNVTATSQPACVQLPNGIIFSVATGGTPPYLYSIDQLKMQTDPSFQVYSGLHRIYTSDAFNCRAESTIQIGVRNIMPMVNFMVASSRYELDTLVIKDVSVPSPERVSWVFSPEAIVISSNTLETKVKYNMAGIYPVKMTGYFGTCEYSLEKLINIAPFDPLVIPKDKFLKGIEKVQVSPNPNSGLFRVKVKLYTKQQIQIKVLDYYSKIHYSARYPETIELEQEINIQGALPGTYVLWVIADNDYKAILFIISQ